MAGRPKRISKSTRTNDMKYLDYLPRPKVQRLERKMSTVVEPDVKSMLTTTKVIII